MYSVDMEWHPHAHTLYFCVLFVHLHIIYDKQDESSNKLDIMSVNAVKYQWN